MHNPNKLTWLYAASNCPSNIYVSCVVLFLKNPTYFELAAKGRFDSDYVFKLTKHKLKRALRGGDVKPLQPQTRRRVSYLLIWRSKKRTLGITESSHTIWYICGINRIYIYWIYVNWANYAFSVLRIYRYRSDVIFIINLWSRLYLN